MSKDGTDMKRLADLRQQVGPRKEATVKYANSADMRRMASNYIPHTRIRAVISEVFIGVQPYVKNWRRFIEVLSEDLGYWPAKWGDGAKSVNLVKFSEGQVGEEEVTWGISSEDPWQPDYEGSAVVDVTRTVDVVAEANVNLWLLPQKFLRLYRAHLTDAEGFLRAVSDVVSSPSKILGKLFASGFGDFLVSDEQEDLWISDKALVKRIISEGRREHEFEISYALDDQGWFNEHTATFKFTGTGVTTQCEGAFELAAEASLDRSYKPPPWELMKYANSADMRVATLKTAVALPSEEEQGKPSHDEDFKAGFAAGKAAYAKDNSVSKMHAEKAYKRVQRKHGSWWVDGYAAAVDLANGAYATPAAQIAKKMRLATSKEAVRRFVDSIHEAQKIRGHVMVLKESKVGVFLRQAKAALETYGTKVKRTSYDLDPRRGFFDAQMDVEVLGDPMGWREFEDVIEQVLGGGWTIGTGGPNWRIEFEYPTP